MRRKLTCCRPHIMIVHVKHNFNFRGIAQTIVYALWLQLDEQVFCSFLEDPAI